MSLSDGELSPSHQTMGLGSTGTIVLSPSRRLLFINRKAIDLVNLLDSDSAAWKSAQMLPTCLMTFAQEIGASHHTIDTDSREMGMPMRRLLGLPGQPVRVQGFTVSCPKEQGRRIVLVLSQWERSVFQPH